MSDNINVRSGNIIHHQRSSLDSYADIHIIIPQGDLISPWFWNINYKIFSKWFFIYFGHSFGHFAWRSNIYSDTLPGIFSIWHAIAGILSDILFHTLFAIYFDIFACLTVWHFLAFYLAVRLSFIYLIVYLAFYLTFLWRFYLEVFWYSIWHWHWFCLSFQHSVWTHTPAFYLKVYISDNLSDISTEIYVDILCDIPSGIRFNILLYLGCFLTFAHAWETKIISSIAAAQVPNMNEPSTS